jgi:uncharacterized glyoxalase superfamily protein PhnB
MPKNPPEEMPRITPYLLYEDVGAAMDWLARAFGFRERMRLSVPMAPLRTPRCSGTTASS